MPGWLTDCGLASLAGELPGRRGRRLRFSRRLPADRCLLDRSRLAYIDYPLSGYLGRWAWPAGRLVEHGHRAEATVPSSQSRSAAKVRKAGVYIDVSV
jgi:hypothetical protein